MSSDWYTCGKCRRKVHRENAHSRLFDCLCGDCWREEQYKKEQYKNTHGGNTPTGLFGLIFFY